VKISPPLPDGVFRVNFRQKEVQVPVANSVDMRDFCPAGGKERRAWPAG
jgi:hypothetical protein